MHEKSVADWKCDNIHIFHWFSDQKVSTAYFGFRLIISIYIVVAYVLSHLQFAWKHYEYKCDGEIDENRSLKHANDTNKFEEKNHLCSLSSVWPYYWLYLTMWSFNFFTICVFLDTGLVSYRVYVQYKNHQKAETLEEASSYSSASELG